MACDSTCLCDRCAERAWQIDVKALLTDIRDLLRWVVKAVSIEMELVLPDGSVLKGGNHMAVTLTDLQSVAVSIKPVDAKGNPAPVDGAPVWEVSDPAVLAIVAAADGMSAVVSAVGPLGAGQVKVTVDADLGQGVKPLVGLVDVEVVASEAVNVDVAVGVPYVPEPPAP